jgi:choline dehydrogenase-like flavoprotein
MSHILEADLCVIGAGSGGLPVAAGAAQMGARVVLIERGRMGGECLNSGCVPIDQGLGVGAMAGVIAPYPTVSEASKRAASAHFAPKLFSATTRKIVGLPQRFG